MALDANDLMMLRGMDSKEGLTPYEQYMVGYKQAKKPSGVAIAGLTVGVVGVVAGATAWIFGGMQASAKAGQAKEAAQAAKEQAALQYQAALNLLNQQNANTNATLDRVIRGLERETDARTSGDLNITTTINDTLSGQQSGQLSASQVATNEATAQIVAGVMTGKYSETPQKVELLTPAQPFQCGCGCNG
jgi:type II secretory pathway pseudopilin PulG